MGDFSPRFIIKAFGVISDDSVIQHNLRNSKHCIMIPGEAKKADEPGDEVLHGEEARARRVHREGEGRVRAGEATPRQHDGGQGTRHIRHPQKDF